MTQEEKELIYLLAQRLTGAHPEGTYQIEIFITNVSRRMRETGYKNVGEYLNFAKDNTSEHAQLLSALSIHTTSWFRENPHYVILQKVLLDRHVKSNYKAWSCACSTGEEVYTLALLFEEFRHFHKAFDYEIHGSDIDPISLETAKRAVYEKRHLSGPVQFYKKHILLGSGNTEDYFTFTPEVRSRCSFKPQDLRHLVPVGPTYDLITCRNVLIYFQAQQVDEIIRNLLRRLNPGGLLVLGHSEIIDHQKFGLVLRGHSVYEKPTESGLPPRPAPLHPTQILRARPQNFNPGVILIGASTGGPEALAHVLERMPGDTPPVVVAQHIAGEFVRTFADRLCQTSTLKLGSFDDRAVALPGHIYFAQPAHHITLMREGSRFTVRQEAQEAINGHRPSIDHLFSSALPFAPEVLGILLSGMGRDGAMGLRSIHQRGAYTITQSEEDCVVFGMPKEAIQLQAVDAIGTATQIHDLIAEIIQRRPT